MRTTLNKAITPNTKKLSSVGSLTRTEDIKKDFREIAEVAATLKEEHPDTRAQYLKGIADAAAAQEAAIKAKEEAETEEAFNKACDDHTHAREKEAFFKRQLERISYKPRMNEVEYYGYVGNIKGAVEMAAEDFRKVAEKAVDEIVAAKKAYMDIVAEADKTLIALDEAANVLQVKHRYRRQTYVNAPDRLIEDPYEWPRHATRFNTGNGKAYDMAVRKDGDWSYKACAAWNAARFAEKKEY